MVTGTSLFLGLFNNLAFLILLVAVYGVLIRYLEQSSTRVRQVIVGLAFGTLAIACMHVKIPVAQGVIVDQRNTVIALCGAFGGPLSAVLCGLMAGAYRVSLGGEGALAGTVGVGLAALAGTFFFTQRDKVDSIFKAALSALVATIIILPGFLLYKDLSTGWKLLKAMALPYGGAVYIGILFCGFLLRHQEKSHLAQVELKRSEKRLRDSQQRLDLALDGANEGIWDWNLESDTLLFDSRYYTIAGYAPNEFPATFEEWEKRVHPDDIRETKTAIKQYLSGDLENFDEEFQFLRKDGGYMWIQGRGKIVARKENGDPIRFIGTHADITQRKKVEESLRIAQFSIDHANIGIYRISPDAQILDVNDKAAQMLGYTKEELTTMSILDIDPNVTMENMEDIRQPVFAKGVDKFETTHQTKDGRVIPVEIFSNLLEYDGQQYSISFVQDITERKEMEQVLLESKERYRTLHEASFGGIFIHDQGIVLDCNQGLSEITGYTFDELIGMDALNTLIAPDWRETVLQNIKSGFSEPYEVEGVRNDGSTYPLYVQGRDLPHEGRIIRAVEYRDITELKQAEEELRKLRNYLSNIINSMPSILVGVDRDGRVTQWNKQAERATGLLSDDAVSKPLDSMFPGLANQMDNIITAIHNRQVIYTPKVLQQEDSETRYEDITIYPLTSNGVEGAVIRVDDVTKEKAIEDKLNTSRKMEAVGLLAGGVAHDFNNMLAGIMGATELLGFHLPDVPKARKLHQMILDSAIRAADLTKQLLAFSRQSDKVSTVVKLHDIIEETLVLLKSSLDRRITIEVNLDAIHNNLVGDPSLLQNALLNLCINASHAMPEGGLLKISTQEVELDELFCQMSTFNLQPGRFIEVEVRDSGCGILQEELNRIFEPFFTTKEKGEGTGLGLSIVYGTIQQHNGAINVYSEVGKGTVFQILLPISSKEEPVDRGVVEMIHGSGCILIVDDEEIIRVTARTILENLGYTVFLAENGKKAVELFCKENNTIDLVLLDMIMPVMNGRDCFEQLRKIDADVKVVLSSGYSREEDLKEMIQGGLSGFIRKPYLTSVLSRVIHDALSSR